MTFTRANAMLGFKGLLLGQLIAVFIMLLALATPAQAQATFTVSRTDDPSPQGCFPGDCSLREAVIAANGTPGSDTIVLQPTTYNLTIPGNGGADQGDLDTTENLDIKSAGPGDATIDANRIDRVLEVVSGGLSLRDITLRNGLATPDGQGLLRGGGVRVFGSLYLYDSRVVDNHMPMVNGADGGGIYNNGHTVVIRSEVSGNTAVQGFGGGIYTPTSGVTEIRDSKLSGNEAVFGGALASASGGGNVLVDRSQLSLNTAGLGGASYQLGPSTYTFTNTTLNGNTAIDGTGGGAIRVRGGSATLNNSTVTRNEAPNGGGLAAANDGSSITIANTIVAGNTDSNQADGNFPDCLDLNAVGVTTHFNTQGYNILGNAQGCQLSPATGDQFGTPAAPVNPLLDSNARFNGGLFAQVFTYAILPGSPAIDGGDPSSSCSSIDARIVQRSLGGRCDSGAYELVKCQTTAVNRVGTFGNDSSTTPELAPTTGADGYLGFDGSDTLLGAEGNDAMCGGSGGDTLTGGPGADLLVGGSDNDTLNGSLGSDRFTGNTGNDTIRARDGKADTVACGAGADRVTADRTDKVAGDCERVSRG
jgi:hypothetical protein